MTDIRAALLQARQRLISALALNSGEARIEAQLLMCQALGDIAHARLLLLEQSPLQQPQGKTFENLLQRRLAGEPVAYILGKREFFGLPFKVTPAVLIPRHETETLVENALARIAPGAPAHVLDLGTGSGAVALAIAHQRRQAEVTAVDASAAALEVARHNATTLQLTHVRLLQSDWFSAVTGESFDVIVSNPPYIASHDPHLGQGDLRFEPAIALASGADGLDAIRHIVRQAPGQLKTGGWLLLEHGYNQAPAVGRLMRAQGLAEVASHKDLAGIERVTLGRAV